ncbi:MAG: phosphotransferase [Rhizomicrobium sp.]
MSGAARLRASRIAAAVPADAPAPSQRILVGHSGASVVLHNQGLNSFVRKTAATAATSARLRAQAEKQHSLWMLGMPFPRVLAQGRDGSDRASFDMEYLPGRTVAGAVLDGAPFDHDALAHAVARMMWLFRECRGAALPASRFHDKIDEIVCALVERESSGAELNEIHRCAVRLRACDWSDIPESPCHGDLTLENILVANERGIVFIDCDDPWVSSFWLDMGKLFQDLDGHWCIRSLYDPGASRVRRTNAVLKLSRLAGDFRTLAAETDPALPARMAQLAALNLFRVLPYARAEGLPRFLCARIDRILG